MTRTHPATSFLVCAALVTATAWALAGIATFIAAGYYEQRSAPPAIERFAEVRTR